jgi:hypothetical protein
MTESNTIATTVSCQSWLAEPFIVTGALQSDLFFVAEPLDLDYEDPNAVVSIEQTEFVAMTDDMRRVDLLVTSAASPQQRPQPQIAKLVQRTAA